MSLLVPPRASGPEILDDRDTPWAVRERSHRDIATSNRWLGGDGAVAAGVARLLAPGTTGDLSVLDLGAGLAGTSAIVRRLAAGTGTRVQCVALDTCERLARSATRRKDLGVCADALALPFPDASIDLVVAALLLHHFDDGRAVQLIRGALRVARIGVVVADLRRTRLAAAGLWLASFPLGFHRVSRHDGVVSVMRGFTVAEVQHLMEAAGGLEVAVTKRAGFRLVATCRPVRVPSHHRGA